MKKWLALLLAAVMSLTAGSALALEVSAPNEFPIVNEPVTLKVLTTMSLNVEDPDTNELTKYVEEKTGVHIEWQNLTQDGSEKISLMLASNSELPDVFMTSEISNEQVVAYGSQGILIPLNDLIDEQGTNMQGLFEYNDTIRTKISAPDGNIYGLPLYGECYHCMGQQKMWINETWLDNLGLEKPETTDELYEVLKAFKEQDANGNGDPNDEIPLVCYSGGWNSTPDMFIMNAFEYNSGEGNAWLKLEDDKIQAAFITDGWKEGLKYLNKLYSEGLMDPETFVTNQEQVYLLSSDSNGNRVGMFPGGVLSNGVDLTSERALEYGGLSPIAGPDGLRQAVKYPEDLQLRYFITSDCEYPEVAFKWGDMLMIDIVSELKKGNYEGEILLDGVEGGTWVRAEEGEVGMDGRQALYKWTEKWGEPQNSSWAQVQPHFATYEYKLFMASAVTTGGVDQERVLYETTLENQEPYWVDKMVPMLMLGRDDSMEAAEIKATIVSYVNEAMAYFITGSWNFDSDWDNYVAQFDAIGLPRLLEIYQNGYEQQYLTSEQ